MNLFGYPKILFLLSWNHFRIVDPEAENKMHMYTYIYMDFSIIIDNALQNFSLFLQVFVASIWNFRFGF